MGDIPLAMLIHARGLLVLGDQSLAGVAIAEWREIVAEHYLRVRAEVIAERLQERGPGSCASAGAR